MKKFVCAIKRRILLLMFGQKPDAVFIPVEASEEQSKSMQRCSNFTMTGPEKLWACISAAEYVVKNEIPGAIVECGVWKGGSTMAMVESLVRLGDFSREVFLYDTFEGMTPPSQLDLDPRGIDARTLLESSPKNSANHLWAISELDEVRTNVESTGYPADLMRFIQGDVNSTLENSKNLPDQIAVLRLDTDWYESTKKELEVLFPRLSRLGVCIVDDYGHWSGSRKAVDEYLLAHGLQPLMVATDYSGRVFVRT
jgi:hypothetical protein